MGKKKFFERNKPLINRFVRQRLGKTKRIVHGSRASNVQLPRFLNRVPGDWDVLAKNPKKAAKGMEKWLDKKFKGDFFSVRPGATKKLKVHKVFANTTGRGVVDFSLPDRKIPTVTVKQIRWATLKDQKQRALKNVKDPSKAFRRSKDLDLLKRIRIFEKQRGRLI